MTKILAHKGWICNLCREGMDKESMFEHLHNVHRIHSLEANDRIIQEYQIPDKEVKESK